MCVYHAYALTPYTASLHKVIGEGPAIDTGGIIRYVIFGVSTCLFPVLPIPKVYSSITEPVEYLIFHDELLILYRLTF